MIADPTALAVELDAARGDGRLLNGGIITDQSEYRPIWAELVDALTSFPAVASPAALGPQ